MERRSNRLRLVLYIARSRKYLEELRRADNEERLWFIEYKRTHNLPADADPYAGDWF